MAKAKKRSSARPPAAKAIPFPSSTLAPQVLEQAAQGWLQSSGPTHSPSRPTSSASDHRLTEALGETLAQLRAEIADLRSRLDRLESR